MRFAVNYSAQGAHLWREGLIQVDCFKCPAWSKLISDLLGIYPIYVHFPLRVGMGIGDALNTETKEKPDWSFFEKIAGQTHTPYFNVHLAPVPEDHPDIPVNDLGSKHSKKMVEYMVRDLRTIVEKFGADKIIAENIYSAWGEHPLSAIVPEVVRDVIEETGCGLLLDISHARQAARELHMDPRDYINTLPLQHLREIHITGIQIFNDYWIDKLRNADVPIKSTTKFINQPIDHLPMTQPDWDFFQWVVDQISDGHWREPEIIAFEYGGIGKGFFEATTDSDILKDQIPRLYNMVHQI